MPARAVEDRRDRGDGQGRQEQVQQRLGF
jgi:hypothetical protein